MLTAIGLSGELFHSAAGTAFADIPVNGHRETWPIRSKRLHSWLRRLPLPGDRGGGERSG